MGGKMSKHNYGWGMSEQKMCIDIKDGDKILFSIFIGEAMENAGRNNVMKHVRECDNSYQGPYRQVICWIFLDENPNQIRFPKQENKMTFPD
jgi:hypothetical protein